jgi:hypothetical protein
VKNGTIPLPACIFHISETPGIEFFVPKPSPSHYEALEQPVVFAIGEKLLHNYLLPRDCPRVCCYASEQSSLADRDQYLCRDKPYKVFVQMDWLDIIKNTTLYGYEFDLQNFRLLDQIADYYVSAEKEKPIRTWQIDDILAELAQRTQLEFELVSDLKAVAEAVKNSTLHFSMIRMRNLGR